MSVEYHIAVDGKSSGPYSLGQLRSMWERGLVTLETHYWTEGMDDWYLVSNLFDAPEVTQTPLHPVAQEKPAPTPRHIASNQRQFRYTANGKTFLGPVSADWLWEEVKTGRLRRNIRVREVGTETWIPFASLPATVFSVQVLQASAVIHEELPPPPMGGSPTIPTVRKKHKRFNTWTFAILLLIGLAYTPLAKVAPLLDGVRRLTDGLLSIVGIHTATAYREGYKMGTVSGADWGHLPAKFPSNELLEGKAASAFGQPITNRDWDSYYEGFRDGFIPAYDEAYSRSTGTEIDIEGQVRLEQNQ
jgi:hypothetical protein